MVRRALFVGLFALSVSAFADLERPVDSGVAAPDQAAGPVAPAVADASPESRFGPYSNLWDRIRDGFQLPSLDSDRVARQVNWFESHPDYMYRLVDRSRRYLYYIVDEVQKRGMPSEIALLPIIESAFDPKAKSPANAVGMWQFIPSTGKLYGMRQDWWFDGRRDVISATNGALDYLEKLHTQFGAWDLALAAYNCGEGAVARAIEKNQKLGRPTDFASLNLPEETRNYVPKLLAAREIVEDPTRHGLNLLPIADQPYFAAISTSRHMDVSAAAKLAGLSESEFLALNPGYNRPVILAKGEQTILVPVANAEEFKSRLDDPKARLVSWRTVQLRRGETYASVASQFGMTGDELKRVNGISEQRKVAGGGVVLVRDLQATQAELVVGSLPEAETNPPVGIKTFAHRLKKGETLSELAQQFNVTVAELKAWNKLSPTQSPRIGQLLVMHRTEESAEASSAKTPVGNGGQTGLKKTGTEKPRKPKPAPGTIKPKHPAPPKS